MPADRGSTHVSALKLVRLVPPPRLTTEATSVSRQTAYEVVGAVPSRRGKHETKMPECSQTLRRNFSFWSSLPSDRIPSRPIPTQKFRSRVDHPRAEEKPPSSPEQTPRATCFSAFEKSPPHTDTERVVCRSHKQKEAPSASRFGIPFRATQEYSAHARADDAAESRRIARDRSWSGSGPDTGRLAIREIQISIPLGELQPKEVKW